jgi:hypothetical protein
MGSEKAERAGLMTGGRFSRIFSLGTLLVCSFSLALSQHSKAQEQGRWAILVAGISGDQALQEEFLKEIGRLRTILEGQLRFERQRVIALFEDPAKAPGVVQFKSTRENLEKVGQDLTGRVGKDDIVFVFLIGHGSSDAKGYKLNLVGPDPTADELAEMLYKIPAQRFVIVNTTTCSGASVDALSRPGKIVVTATKSGSEKNQTHMGGFFVEAFENNNADQDKNGRVSILEAFSYAVLKVEEWYNKEGNLQTEHPVLDDNGDVQANAKPSPENGDGFLARTTYLDAGAGLAAKAGLSTGEQALAREAQELERNIEALKYEKPKLREAEYEQKLEALLLRLAEVNAKLRKN